jgi:hypothetical protein
MQEPLQGMTQAKWDALTPSERESIRDNGLLTPQLSGLEGWQVEVTDTDGAAPRRFIVGKSTGWRPIHLELSNARSRGGDGANKQYATVRKLRKVRC